jgi:hypothetical protein
MDLTITAAISRIKSDVGHYLTSDAIKVVCRKVGHTWREDRWCLSSCAHLFCDPREVRDILNDQGLSSPDHLKSLLSWVLVLKFVHVQVTPRAPLGCRDMPESGRPDQNHSGGAWSAT